MLSTEASKLPMAVRSTPEHRREAIFDFLGRSEHSECFAAGVWTRDRFADLLWSYGSLDVHAHLNKIWFLRVSAVAVPGRDVHASNCPITSFGRARGGGSAGGGGGRTQESASPDQRTRTVSKVVVLGAAGAEHKSRLRQTSALGPFRIQNMAVHA